MNQGISEVRKKTADSGRNEFLDTLKGFAIFGVVCVHFGGSFATSSNAWTPSFYVGLALSEFFHLSVPLFVFVSGLLASPYLHHRQVGIGRYYLERIVGVGWPYLIASVAAFFWLRGGPEFSRLSTDSERFSWILSRLFYYGIHPTYYFIPMILLLYLLKPFLNLLVPAICRFLLKKANLKIDQRIAILSFLLLFIITHLVLGLLANNNKINFYTWCRPNPIFWLPYFYFGMVFPEVSKMITLQNIRVFIKYGIGVILIGYIIDWIALTNVSIVGKNFELNRLSYAYARPEIMVLNMLAIVIVSAFVAIRKNQSSAIFSFLGLHSLQIYLWHLFVLYFLAWRNASVLLVVKSAPELIVGFALFTAILVAVLKWIIDFILSFPGRYTINVKIGRVDSP